MNKIKRSIALVLLLFIAATLFAGCQHRHKFSEQWSYNYSSHWREPTCGDTDETADKGEHSYNENDVCTICGYTRPAKMYIFPVNGNFHTDLQGRFLDDDYENVFKYADGREEKSLPQNVGIHWTYQPNGLPIESLKRFVLTISCNKGDAVTLNLEPNLNEYGIQEYSLQNVYLNALYDVTVQAIDNDNQVIQTCKAQFNSSAKGPRNLKIDGVTNVRDLGGYVTDQGEIKQGLLLRTARLNKSGTDEVTVEITDEGIRTMLDELKVKTEIDLRSSRYESGSLTASVLGKTVNYRPVRMDAANMFEQKDEVKQIFDILCDKNNYPAFFHCHIGTDRTGFVAFLCLALLSADEQTLYVDYLFSNFGHIGGGRFPYTIFTYIDRLNSYDGESLAARTESYLLECGVTAEQIASFKDIMLIK